MIAGIKNQLVRLKVISDRLKSNRGITLVEVLVSIALLGIVVMLLANAMLTGLYVMKSNLQRSKNSMHAGGAVAAAGVSSGSSASSDVSINASPGTGTVTIGQGSSAITAIIPGNYQNGTANGPTSSDDSVGYWSFNPSN